MRKSYQTSILEISEPAQIMHITQMIAFEVERNFNAAYCAILNAMMTFRKILFTNTSQTKLSIKTFQLTA